MRRHILVIAGLLASTIIPASASAGVRLKAITLPQRVTVRGDTITVWPGGAREDERLVLRARRTVLGIPVGKPQLIKVDFKNLDAGHDLNTTGPFKTACRVAFRSAGKFTTTPPRQIGRSSFPSIGGLQYDVKVILKAKSAR